MSYKIDLSLLTNMASLKAVEEGRWTYGASETEQLIVLVAILERLQSIAAALDSIDSVMPARM